MARTIVLPTTLGQADVLELAVAQLRLGGGASARSRCRADPVLGAFR
ncbi:hypothetical protein ACFC00_20390 [Streptomyces adustus]